MKFLPSIERIKDRLLNQVEENPTNWHVRKVTYGDFTEVSVECHVPQVDTRNYLNVVSAAINLVWMALTSNEFNKEKIDVQFMQTQSYSVTFDVVFNFEIK